MRAPMAPDASQAFDDIADGLYVSETGSRVGTDGMIRALWHQHGTAIVAAKDATGYEIHPFRPGSEWVAESWAATGGEHADIPHVVGLCMSNGYCVSICGHPFDADLVGRMLMWIARNGFWTAKVDTFPTGGGHALRVHAGEIVVVVMGLKPGTPTAMEIPLRPTAEG